MITLNVISNSVKQNKNKKVLHAPTLSIYAIRVKLIYIFIIL
jgi:hypothetical protein